MVCLTSVLGIGDPDVLASSYVPLGLSCPNLIGTPFITKIAQIMISKTRSRETRIPKTIRVFRLPLLKRVLRTSRVVVDDGS